MKHKVHLFLFVKFIEWQKKKLLYLDKEMPTKRRVKAGNKVTLIFILRREEKPKSRGEKILQASPLMCEFVDVQSQSQLRLFATPWTAALDFSALH